MGFCKLVLAARHFSVPPIPHTFSMADCKEVPCCIQLEIALMMKEVAEIIVIIILGSCTSAEVVQEWQSMACLEVLKQNLVSPSCSYSISNGCKCRVSSRMMLAWRHYAIILKLDIQVDDTSISYYSRCHQPTDNSRRPSGQMARHMYRDWT